MAEPAPGDPSEEDPPIVQLGLVSKALERCGPNPRESAVAEGNRMKPRVAPWVLSFLCLGALSQASCGWLAGGALVAAAVSCPELVREDVDPITVEYTNKKELNAKIAAFVAASADLLDVAIQAEETTRDACRAIGRDLGLTQEQMAPVDGVSGATAGACGAVAKRMRKILARGLQLQVTVEPPRCQLNAELEAGCNAQCAAAGGEQSAKCSASCRARADLRASCSPPQVSVRGTGTDEEAARLIASLQAHLPALVAVQLDLVPRVARNVDAIASFGASLPTVVEEAGEKAASCVGAGITVTTVAASSMAVVVDANMSVTSQVGVSK